MKWGLAPLAVNPSIIKQEENQKPKLEPVKEEPNVWRKLESKNTDEGLEDDDNKKDKETT